MIITATYLVTFVLNAVKEKWGYVLGGNGEMYSRTLAETWAKTRNKPKSWIGTKTAYFVSACKRWFGHFVVDCSGLIIAAVRSKKPTYQDQKADTLYSRCKEKGSIKTIPEIPGLCVWKKGHIGVYIGDGNVVESRGRTYGVVITKLSKRPWTNWGKLADVDYSKEADEVMDLLASGNKGAIARGQKTLTFLGYKGDMDETKYGIPGDKTRKSVNLYKKAHGLPQDGKLDEVMLSCMLEEQTEKYVGFKNKADKYAADCQTSANKW